VRKNDLWASVTFEGNRRRQHEEFQALSFAEKIKRLEQAQEVSDYFARVKAQRSAPKGR